jgi:hypothetical protein
LVDNSNPSLNLPTDQPVQNPSLPDNTIAPPAPPPVPPPLTFDPGVVNGSNNIQK